MLLPLLFVLSGSAAPRGEAAPKLVVVLSVDQMRADFLDRYAPMFEGGFARLLREGAVFSNCTLGHAFTETGPGHAALLSGRHPGEVGIVENQWFDRRLGEVVYCVGDPAVLRVPTGTGASPARFDGDTLGDWMKRANPKSRVVSIAGKDRSAVLMGGKKPDGAYWASEEGFATSTYYRRELPGWLAAWNAKKTWESFAGTKWEASLDEELLRAMRVGPDPQPGERLLGGDVFPHALPPLGPAFVASLPFTPFSDALTLAAAREAILGEGLGADDDPDLLCLGLSAADYVGHACGSGSRESAEHFRLLDRYLGDFLAFAEAQAGKGRLLVALSADHGVLDLPERLSPDGRDARRVFVRGDDAAGMGGVKRRLVEAFGEGEWIPYHDYRSLFFDRKLCESKGVPVERVADEAAKACRALDWVADAYTRAELAAATPRDEFVPLYRHSFREDRAGDLFLRHKEGVLVYPRATGTTHGGPYLYDRAVPFVLTGPGIPAGKRADAVHTIDLGPTLAELVGVPIPPGLSGRSRASFATASAAAR